MTNKKTLLSFLIANALAVSASTQASEFEIYGTIAAAVESLDNGSSTGTTSTTEVSNNHSAFGVKGSYDMDNDLRAVYLFDAFLGTDSGDSGNGSLYGGGRDGYVGLDGGFGTVALGYHGRPWKTSTNNMDIFGSTIADYSALMGNTSDGNTYFDGGIGNSVIWFMPKMANFSGHLQFGADEADDESNDTGLQVNYTQDKFYAVISYDVDGRTGGGDVTASKFAAQYEFGDTTVGAIFDSISDSAVNTRDAFWFAGSHKMDKVTYKAAFAQASDSDAGADGATYVALGVDYSFMSNVTGYLIYSQISNETGGSYGFVSAPHTSSNGNAANGVAAGDDTSVIAVGLKVDFGFKKTL